jgi:hypothetical protein
MIGADRPFSDEYIEALAAEVRERDRIRAMLAHPAGKRLEKIGQKPEVKEEDATADSSGCES